MKPIIDQQTFDLVQKIRGNVRRYPDGWGEAAPLTGLLYCADCGGKMYVHRTNNGKRISQYTCSQYSKVPVGKLCTTQHRINEDVVLSLVSEMLKAIALFLIMSDTDSTFNFLISMVYTQLFNLLCDKADDVYGGKLPIHVRCLIDECANIGQIPNLEKLVATIRSREISACLVLQARSQLKAIYKDNADTIVGNMDSQIFLGGSEPTTLKDLSEMLGKETIDAFNTSDTRGNSPSYGTTFQKMGHELLSRDELAVLDGGKCILQLRGVRPFLSDKYDLTQHPNYKLTSDYDPKNTFDIEKYLNRKEKIHPGDEFIVVDADSLPSA